MQTAPDLALASITDELAHAELDISNLLTIATGILSRLKAGTWVAMVMNDDPATSRIVTTDDADPAMASYIDNYISSLDRPGRAPTIGMSRRVIESGGPVLIPSMPFEHLFTLTTPAARKYFDEYAPPRTFRTVGLLVVPMRARDLTIGTLALLDWDTRHGLDEADVAWIQTVADRLAISVEHVQCHSAAGDRLERLNAIRSIGLALASSDDLKLTMQVILEQVSGRLKADAADILLVDDLSQELYPAASFGFHSVSAPDFRLPITADILAQGPGRIHDMRPRPGLNRQLRLRAGFTREGFHSCHAVSLISRGQLLGVMEVFHRSDREVDQEWVGFLEAMGSIAAIAIDNLGAGERPLRADSGPGMTVLAPKPRLTEVDWQIVALVIDGATNREIGTKLHLSESTIKFHVRRILETVGADNRTELARKATQRGWL